MATVLIIDDDEISRTIIHDIVRLCGHKALVAGDGREGLIRYRDAFPDVVVTDILMPECEGIEVIRTIRRDGLATQIIAVSAGGAFGRDYVLTMAERIGADFVLTKPFDFDALTLTLHQAASRARGFDVAIPG